MNSRLISFALIITLVFSVFGGFCVSAESSELMTNGGFEDIKVNGMPDGWKNTGTVLGENFEISADAHGGKNAVRMHGTDASVILYQVINIAAGSKYTLSYWLKDILGTGAVLKMEFGNSTGFYGEDDVYKKIETGKKNTWVEQKMEFTAPDGATQVALLFRLQGTGDIYWDDISFIGEKTGNETEKAQVAAAPKKMVASGGEQEHIQNGDLEALKVDGSPKVWALTGGTLNENCEISSDAHGGKNALRMHGNSQSIILRQSLKTLVEGSKYTLNIWIKDMSGTGAVLKLEFANSSGFYGEDDMYLTLTPEKTKEWYQKTITFTAPKDVQTVAVLLRLQGSGDVYWDDISLVGDMAAQETEAPGEKEETVEFQKPMEGAGELIVNGDYEKRSGDGGLEGWSPITKVWKDNKYIEITSEQVHSGNTAVKIETAEGGNPWIRTEIKNVEAEAEYQLSLWYNAAVESGKATCKLEFYNAEAASAETSLGKDTFAGTLLNTNGEWKQYVYRIVMPKGTKMLVLYPRLLGTGTVFFDDVSLYKINNPAAFDVVTDEIFYYSDLEGYGTAEAHVNTGVYPELIGQTMQFNLKDGQTVLESGSGVISSEGKASFRFKLSLLSELKKEYSVEAAPLGSGIAAKSTSIYKYPRPTYLNQMGEYIKDGKVINPVVVYHADPADYPALRAAGVNVAQAYFKTMSSDKALDYAKEQGMMILYPLYRNMLPAGNPANRENTIRVINKYKDHPAIFGWMVMDEPYGNDADPKEDLIESYKLIRELDPNHPVYMLEGPVDTDHYEIVGNCCDIFAIDPYPGAGYLGSVTDFVSYHVDLALKAVKYRKPVYTILQTFDWPEGKYTPTKDDLRNMLYQAYMGGSTGVGYYCFEDAIKGLNLDKTEMWNALNGFELETMFDIFVGNKYKNFNEYKDESIWWRSFEKDGKIYVTAINRKNPYNYDKATITATPAENADVSAAIPLKNFDGTVSLSGFSGKDGDGNTVSGNGVLNISLRRAQAVLYEITPDSPIDFSKLVSSGYVDLGNYSWARTQIEALRDRDIVNDITPVSYAPGRNITRADFAMFLVKTLGLTGGGNENFDDVDSGAYYAKYIAAGKAAGILKGVGENKYNPEAEISRQDMMTIIARGLNLSGDSDLSVFSDSNSISDYALESTKAMIASGLVKGNADGTINPKGNTTRAEAAVIMYRITLR